MSEKMLDPSANLTRDFIKLVKATTIKYSNRASKTETMENKMKADEYLDAVREVDNFYSYIDYLDDEFHEVGLYNNDIIDAFRSGKYDAVPEIYREPLLELRRKRVITMFEEKNDYYRCLNGFPDVEDKDYIFIPIQTALKYNIDRTIPLHLIQDHYNNIETGKGDYYIQLIEGTGFIDDMIARYPEKKYLNYIGSNRIDLYTARNAKNFQIIQLRKTKVRQSIINQFTNLYDQCREYFVKVIYMKDYVKFMDYYDNFIGLCIMVMTFQQIASKQISLGIKRDYFDIYAIRELYIMYDIPYNLYIDEDTQADIVQNLNLLIQNKATDRVIYNLADLLGFTNINVYKYYLTKDHKLDAYDVPIFKYTTRFNTDTGETSVVPDYEAMYDLYFQKYELKNEDFMNSFADKRNRVEYEDVVSGDPFWWTDQNLYDRIWTTEYNFVESKYLSLGVSYSMTEVLFENIVFIKMMMQDHELFRDISLKLPKIAGNSDVSLFDTIILLVCLTAAKHRLYGEIISIPTQVISVLDYLDNTERPENAPKDTFLFNYNYFFNPESYEDQTKMNGMKDDLIDYINSDNNDDVNSFGYNFNYFSTDNPDREEHFNFAKEILDETEYENFVAYVNSISSLPDTDDQTEKINILNEMYRNIKNLYKLINYAITKTDDRNTYESLKQLYKALFITKEVNDTFKIQLPVVNESTGEVTMHERTAWTYFEYLYNRNPKLYNQVFHYDEDEALANYNSEHGTSLSLTEFNNKIATGEIFIDYSDVITSEEEENNYDEVIYTHINHIVSRLEIYISELNFMNMMNDSSTALEKLLLQLVRFFKSYTVDVLGLDVLYIFDFKMDNTIKFFDEIQRISKIIQTDEKLNLSYGDCINTITSILQRNEKLIVTDKLLYIASIIIDHLYDNSVRLDDMFKELTKSIQMQDDSLFNLTDFIRYSTDMDVRDKNKTIGLSDSIARLWYTD